MNTCDKKFALLTFSPWRNLVGLPTGWSPGIWKVVECGQEDSAEIDTHTRNAFYHKPLVPIASMIWSLQRDYIF